MAKTRSVATRMDIQTIKELKKIFPNETPSQILRMLADEKIAIHRNTENLYAARRALSGKKADRSMI